MTVIPIQINGKIAVCSRQYVISANSDYVLSFCFDSAWDDVSAKTARLIFDECLVDLPFTGSAVALPRIPDCAHLFVGVFCDTMASTAVEIGCITSVADSEASPVEALSADACFFADNLSEAQLDALAQRVYAHMAASQTPGAAEASV